MRPAMILIGVGWMSLVGALWFGSLSLPAQENAKKQPTPAKALQDKSRTMILEIFAEDFEKAKGKEDHGRLASTLLAQARDPRNDPADRFALYTLAEQAAVRAGDAPLALQVLDELAREFDLPATPLELKAVTLDQLVQTHPPGKGDQALIELILPMIHDAVEADQYEVALKLGTVAEKAASMAQAPGLLEAVRKRNDEVRAVQKGFSRLQAYIDRLKKNPADPEANLELGKYNALLKGRWDRALPLLAKGSDPALRDQARKDLAKPKDAHAQLDVADGWWDLAKDAKDPHQLHLQKRAEHWYEQALLQLSGLNRSKAQKRIELVTSRLAGVPVEGPIGPVGELRVLKGHGKEVKSVAFSPDGRQAASGSVDETIRIWDLATGKEDKTLRGHSKQVWNVAWLPNGRQVLSASWDGTARLWDVRTGMEVKRYPHPIDVNGLAVARDGQMFLTGCDDKHMYLWAVGGEEQHRYGNHGGFTYAVAFCPDGRHVASGSVDRTIRVYDQSTGQLVRVLEGMTDAVTSLAFVPDGRHLVSAGDQAAHLWDWTTGKEIRRFEHGGQVTSLALSADGRRLLTGGSDRTVRLWDLATGKELHRFQGHSDTVTSVAISPDGRRALSGSMDQTLRLWGLPAR